MARYSNKVVKYGRLDNRYRRRSHNIFKDILQKYSKREFPKILDVGYASGVIGMIKKSPENIFGIECNEELIRQAKNNCEKVYKIDLNDFKKDDVHESDFDFIFCGDVLEHVLNPESLLRELTGLLSQDGNIVVSLLFRFTLFH